MELKVKSYSSQSSLISSIIFFIIGAILFSNADRVIEIISIAIGLILATTGIISLVIYYFKLKKNNHSETGSLTLGIITIILAIIFIFFSSLVEQFIRFIIGGWILFSGIIRLINALSSGKRNTIINSICFTNIGWYLHNSCWRCNFIYNRFNNDDLCSN